MNLALFDFDGTITTQDTFTRFLHYAIDRRRLLLGRLVLAPMVLGYKLGIVSMRVMRASAAWVGFRGAHAPRVWRQGRRYARDVLPGVLRADAMARIAWHQAQGDVVVVVSASIDPYLAPWCRQHGLALICNEIEVRGRVLTGRMRERDCGGAEKSRRVLERYDLSEYAEVYAYGDTVDDHAMLGIADRRYFRGQELARQ